MITAFVFISPVHSIKFLKIELIFIVVHFYFINVVKS